MSKKIFLTFIMSLLLSFITFEWSFRQMTNRQEELGIEQSRLIQIDVKDHFSLFLNIPATVAYLSADNLASGELNEKKYGDFSQIIMKNNKQMLGLNLMNELGRIIEVYPADANSAAKNKISQNYKEMMKSYLKGEPFWLSPPFMLYQGQLGFAFYVPIIKQNKLRGWIAPVISAKSFFNEFRAYKYFKTYELIIKDKATDKVYFGTAINPVKATMMLESEYVVLGRNLIFQSWRKNNALSFDIHWSWTLFGSFILASLVTLVMYLQEQRKKASHQLQNISTLLNLTAKEALSNLIDIHSEINKLGESGTIRTGIVPRDVDYITNLIEQIDLLQSMAQTGEELEKETVKLLPLIQDQLTEMSELILKKNLKLVLNQDSFQSAIIHCNTWLFKNIVLRNLITHTILVAKVNATITIHFAQGDKQELYFKIDQVYLEPDKEQAFKLDRRLEVTRNVMLLHEGELTLNRDLEGGLSLKLSLLKD